MERWEVWSNIGADGGAICLPRLKRLRLTDCPNLRGNLPVHVPSLVELNITGCVLLKWLLPRVPAARVLVRQQASCPCHLAELPKALVVTSITQLSLAGLEGLEYLPTELVMLSSLSVFSTSGCDNLRSLADVQLPPSLKSLYILYCNALESLPDVLPPLHKLVLVGCQRLICIPGSSLPTSLRNLEVSLCSRWEFPISIERMKHYTCLETLELSHTSEHLVCFPLGVFPNLRTLWLANCEGLEKVCIPEGIEDDSLASLCGLHIWSCYALEMIGKETGRGEATTELPAPNLTALSIRECGKVKPVVVEREGEVLLPKLQNLLIDNSASGESPHSLTRSLFKFSCLTCLEIRGLEVECFPVAGEGLPTSLTRLSILKFGKLRKLDGEALLNI